MSAVCCSSLHMIAETRGQCSPISLLNCWGQLSMRPAQLCSLIQPSGHLRQPAGPNAPLRQDDGQHHSVNSQTVLSRPAQLCTRHPLAALIFCRHLRQLLQSQ